jgi:hypothetical protein
MSDLRTVNITYRIQNLDADKSKTPCIGHRFGLDIGVADRASKDRNPPRIVHRLRTTFEKTSPYSAPLQESCLYYGVTPVKGETPRLLLVVVTNGFEYSGRMFDS